MLSLIDVSETLFGAGAPPLREAILQPHVINPHPLRLSNLQRHREQAGVQQERGCLLGTARVRQLSGTRSGSPHCLPQPEREIGHSSHQPTGHTLHPAVPQVHSKQHNKNFCLPVRPPPLLAHCTCVCLFLELGFTFACSPSRTDVNESSTWCFSFRPNDFSSEGFNNWTFMTTHSWDEEPQGEWTLEIENTAAIERDYGNYVRLR